MNALVFSIVIFTFVLYVTSIHISPCAKWNRKGVTIAGTDPHGQSKIVVLSPQGIFIDKQRDLLYISDGDFEGRIRVLSLNKSGSEPKLLIEDIINPGRFYVVDDIQGPIIYITLPYLNYVQKWLPGSTHGIQIGGYFSFCEGVTVDSDGYVYVSESVQECVSRWSPQTNQTETIAGRRSIQGVDSSHLFLPAGIYRSNSTGDMYIADEENNRIQKWAKNASKGVTVAGSKDGFPGWDNSSLDHPKAIWFDEQTEVLYVADGHNYRIQRYRPGALQADTIAGGVGT